MFNLERGHESNQEESPSVDLQRQIDRLTKTGVHLPEIVKLLGAEEYLHDIGTAKNPVFQFDVKSFIESRSPEGERVILPSTFVHTHDVILPPDEGEIITGSGAGFEKIEIIPRTARFIRLLSEFNLQYSVIEGTNDQKMIRELSYRIFDIPEIKKVAFVNDEEGNATFVINDFDSETEQISDYASLTKDQLKELSVGKMTLVVYPGTLEEWAIAMRAALEDRKKPYEAAAQIKKIDKEQSADKALYEKAPEGWITNRGLGDQLGVGRMTVRDIADRQQQAHPEWFVEYLDATNKRALHYNPELVEHVTKQISARGEHAPEGWMTMYNLSNNLDVGSTIIQEIADRQQQAHPEWFAKYLDGRNIPRTYYSPKLVEHITQEVSTRGEKIPEGWTTISGLAKQLDVGEKTIKRIVNQQRQAHPEWFREYLSDRNRPYLHYSPEFVEYVKKEISALEQAPEGWVTTYGVANKLGIDSITVKRMTDQQRQAHPEWFVEYLDKMKRPMLHYSPELVEYMTKKISVREQAPEGWVTNNGLVNHLGVTVRTIKSIADQQRQTHPEWFVEYLDKSKKLELHYSPELVDYITKHIEPD
jgi:hypothetical protein